MLYDRSTLHTYLSALKTKIISFKTSKNMLHKSLYYSTFILWKVTSVPYRFLFNPEYRSLILLKHFKAQHVHQISNYTAYNRYPDLFLTSKRLIGGKKNIKILSFGCSTGEEAYTLREYFPDALIIGVDINKHNIQKAISKNHDPKIIFSYDIEKTIQDNGPFDIIFALAVLQRTQNRYECTYDSSHIYPFNKFNTQITQLNCYLKSNGIFAIDFADYLFEDTDVASQYHALKGSHNVISDRLMFKANNQRMKNNVLLHRVFIKK